MNKAKTLEKALENRRYRLFLAEQYAQKPEFESIYREMAMALDQRLFQILEGQGRRL